MWGPNDVKSISSNCRLMEPNGAFVVGLFIGGSSSTEHWGRRLGDASSFNWPNRAFRASKMRGDASAFFSWGPRRAFMAYERRKPHSYHFFFHFSLIKLVASSTWVQLIGECTDFGNVGKLLVNSPTSICRDDLAYWWEVLSIWLQSRLKVVC